MTTKTADFLVTEAEDYVKKLLVEQLTDDHRYHNLQHTLSVRQAVLEIGRRLKRSPDELEILELAALFHDTGFTEIYEGHEAVSHRMAAEFLARHNYPREKTAKVLACIDATFPPKRPESLLEEIIRDADLANLGNPSYPETLAALRHEWKVFLNQDFPDNDWYRLNRDFIKKVRFFTQEAEEMWGANKLVNEKYLKRMAKHTDQTRGKDPSTIQGNRSAQMMFKTALRNHLDLSSLADNKANIMLSVNALILTIAAPLALSYVKDYVILIVPLIFLLLTCLASMIFATMATRPIKMTGHTSKEQIEKGRSNLFFFGNFYAMSLEAYSEGMKEVIEDNDKLENSIRRDLYYLGKSLGNKYRRLRICYNIFMVGMIITIFAMIIAYSVIVLK